MKNLSLEQLKTIALSELSYSYIDKLLEKACYDACAASDPSHVLVGGVLNEFRGGKHFEYVEIPVRQSIEGERVSASEVKPTPVDESQLADPVSDSQDDAPKERNKRRPNTPRSKVCARCNEIFSGYGRAYMCDACKGLVKKEQWEAACRASYKKIGFLTVGKAVAILGDGGTIMDLKSELGLALGTSNLIKRRERVAIREFGRTPLSERQAWLSRKYGFGATEEVAEVLLFGSKAV